MGVRGRRLIGIAAVAAMWLPQVAVRAHADDGGAVYILDAPLAPAAMPSGLTPSWIAGAVPGAVVIDAATVDAGPGDVLINPYGEAYPATAAVEGALADGAAFVNLAGEPFRRPNGTNDGQNPPAHGVFVRGVDPVVVTGTRPTALGAARTPSSHPTTFDRGVAIHAADPMDERELSQWYDAVGGIDAGPAIVFITEPTRVVAVGHRGDTSPLHPSQPGAAALLAELVEVASEDTPEITIHDVAHATNSITVDASAEGGSLTGAGTHPTPDPWSPDEPTLAFHTVSLHDGAALLDQVVLPANPALVTTAGQDLLVNGTAALVKGMSSGGSDPPGLDEADTAAVLRWDFERMHEVGVNAYRRYSPTDDWTLNVAAANGILIADTIGMGWEIEVTDAKVEAQVPWVRFIGARARTAHNVVSIGLGNEWLDHDAARATAAIERLATEARDANGGVHPIVYTQSHEEPLVLGELPWIDLYAVNCYGMTYPTSAADPAFVLCVEHGKQMAGERPFLVSEWGANTFLGDGAQAAAAHHAGADLEEQESLRAALIWEKWLTMQALDVQGGYAFQWSDGLGKCLINQAHCTVTNNVENPPGSGYMLLNHEQWWGFHDVRRRPRRSLFTLEHLYLGRDGVPPGVAPVSLG